MSNSSKIDRKNAARAFKEAAVPRGIFSVICSVTGEKWVGSSKNLGAQKNSIWFQLNHGNFRIASLQSAWKQHGEQAFLYEVVETLPEDIPELSLEDTLKERRSAWAAALQALEIR
ncbi:MAG: GIY-YIG nuclease family protein [Acidobacteria bacterium]|nr:GIY-YIG nuclease family protein [Acidobacteriota bacterium]